MTDEIMRLELSGDYKQEELDKIADLNNKIREVFGSEENDLVIITTLGAVLGCMAPDSLGIDAALFIIARTAQQIMKQRQEPTS